MRFFFCNFGRNEGHTVICKSTVGVLLQQVATLSILSTSLRGYNEIVSASLLLSVFVSAECI